MRSIPNNQEAEQAVLSSMFISKYALDKASDSLNEDSFYYENNRIIFKTLVDLASANKPIDMPSVILELKNNNHINEIGGIPYLTEVLNTEAVAANVEYYIKKVSDASLMRSLIKTAEDIQNMGYNTTDEVEDVLDEAERKVLNIVKNKRTTEFRDFKDILYSAQANLEKLSREKGEVTGVPTGWYDLDKMTAGFHENQLIIVAARPAMGKTVFALNVATNVALHANKSVAIFNLEMGAEQLANRMLSSVGQIEGRKFMSGNFDNNDWARLNEAISQMENAKIYISDTPGITIGEIRSKCRRLASSEEGLGLVIIDYLQLVSGGKNYGTNRQQEVSDISRALKLMALELKVPVIALSQLSRNVELREDKRPLMSDLRESGSIEQDADIVAFLYRDSYYKKQGNEEGNANLSEVIIGKHRNGRTGTINLIFKGDTCSFLNYAKEEG